MRRVRTFGCILLPIAAAACAGHVRPPAPGPVVEYANARCFDGRSFAPCRLFVAGGRFVAPVARADSVVDLGGRWVVPPFGEAHNHDVEASPRLDATLDGYRRAGVLYVLNPNSLPGARAALAARPGGGGPPWVAFANGGITGPGGHPIPIAAANVARGRWTAADGEGAFFHTVRDVPSLDSAWRALHASRPDVVKVYLLYSDRYAERLADTATHGWRGMDPALVPQVVRRARAAGLRVAAHVETAADFRAAVRGGVDVIAHVPGFRGDERTRLRDPAPFTLTPADAREAAARGVAVVTTLSGLARYAAEEKDTTLLRAADALARANLGVLRDAGVRLAVGSDEYGETSVAEARYLAGLGVLTRAEVLRMWGTVTPQVIFPGRRVGRLEPGFEASFLVLDADPLADFAAVGRISRIVALGRELPAR